MTILCFLNNRKTATFIYGLMLPICWCLNGCSGQTAGQDQVANSSKAQVRALTLIKNDDCLNCHSIEDKSVGPSYLRVAQRYKTDNSTIDRLTDKIIEGGGGLWGADQMTKHPLLKKEKARKIVRWILSLDDTLANKDPMFATSGINLTQVLKSKQPGKGKGLMLKAYILEDLNNNFDADGFPEIPKNILPIDSGVVKTVHFPEQESFLPLQENFILKATGFITITRRGKYFFKQVKGGKGRVILDGATIINENNWDTEIDKDLSPGKYPITVEYLSRYGKNALSLQWITPEDEYYEVIPGEVFTYVR